MRVGGGDASGPAALGVPDPARQELARAAEVLGELVALQAASPLAPRFRAAWLEVLALFDRYQELVIAASPFRATCGRGCHHCCNHWVDDVASFEAEIIADHLRRGWPHEIPRWLERWRGDREAMERLVDSHARREDALAAYQGLGRTCPLVDPGGACRVYPLRPLVCRGFVSFSEPALCDPAHPRHPRARTYLFDLEGRAHELLDELDLQHERAGSARGLAEILPRALERPGG